MRNFKKFISAVTAAAMTFTMAASGMTGGIFGVSAADKSAVELVNDMGMGWNLGNTFDAWGVTWTDETWTGWGNSMPSKDLFSALHAEGFDSVRLPITWYQHTDAATFDIDDAYLERIKTVIDYARDADMYVIINMHWDWESGKSLWLNKGEGALPQFTTMWTEIANYFKDYDEHLVFEDMNEVGWDSPYSYTDNDYNILNKLNSEFVSTIRATGGNNADRLLLLAGANTDLDQTCSTKFVVPDDPMLAVSIHYYRPSTFCVAEVGANWGYRADWGTDADVNAVYNDFAKMKSVFADKGIPVILGESGVANAGKFNKDKDSIHKFLKTVNSTALNTSGISCFLWDDSGHGDLNYYDRVNLEWFDSEVGAIFRELSGGTVDGPAFEKKNRVTLKASDIPVEEGSMVVDLTPYGAQGATLKSIILNGTVTGGEYVGFGLGFDAYRDGSTEATWSAEKIQIKEDGSATEAFDGIAEDKDGEYNYEIVMKYLQIQKWWADGSATADIDTVTLVFDKEIDVIDTGTEDPVEEPPAEEPPAEEPPAEDPPAEDPPVEEPPAEDPPAEEPVEVKEPEGLYVALEGQYAGNAFWEPIYFADNIPEFGTGSYTITVDNVGTTKASDLILFLESNIDIYDYKNDPEDETSTGLTDGNVELKITSVLVDGKEVAYTPADAGTSDDGKHLRLNIYNTYADVTSIDPEITVEEGITVNFDLTLKQGSKTPSEETPSDDTPSGDFIYGDVNGDGVVDIMDVIAINKFLLGSTKLEGDAKKAADVDLNDIVDSTDSLNILKFVVDLNEKLPV